MPGQFSQQPLIHVVQQQQQLLASPTQQYMPQQPQHIQIVYKGSTLEIALLTLTFLFPVQGAAVPPIVRMPQPQQQAHRY